MSELTQTRGTCKECKHSRMTTQMGGQGLFCHRYPPQFVMRPHPQKRGEMFMEGFWAPVDPSENCGEWQVDPLVRQ